MHTLPNISPPLGTSGCPSEKELTASHLFLQLGLQIKAREGSVVQRVICATVSFAFPDCLIIEDEILRVVIKISYQTIQNHAAGKPTWNGVWWLVFSNEVRAEVKRILVISTQGSLS